MSKMVKRWRRASKGTRLLRRTSTLLALMAGIGCSYYSADMLEGLSRGGADSGSAGSAVGGSSTTTAGGSHGGAAGSQPSPGGTEAGGALLPTGGAGGSDDETPLGEAGAGVAGASAGAGGADDGPVDACPDDPIKMEPGQCGCGVSELCAKLKAGLAHRYAFAQAGSVATDSIGSADGTIVGVTASQGKVAFDGTADAYVNLPNGIVSALKDASFEIWLSWGGGGTWQRIFDFGRNDQGEDKQGVGTTYLYLTPSDGSASPLLRASFTINGLNNETVAKGSAPLPTTTTQHLVLVVDDTQNQLRLYLNGSVTALTGLNLSLSGISDLNNWIGRSNYKDAPLKATIEEVRIYKVALDDALAKASFDFGPNPSFL